MLAPLLKIWKGCANQGETVKPEQDQCCCSVSIPYKHEFLVLNPNAPCKTCFSTCSELVISWCMSTLCLVELVTPWYMISLCLTKYVFRIAWSIHCEHLLHNVWLPFRMICIFTFILTFMVAFLLVNYLAPVDKLTTVLFSTDLNFSPKKGTSKSQLGAALSNPDLRWDSWLASPRDTSKLKLTFMGQSWIWSFSLNIQV